MTTMTKAQQTAAVKAQRDKLFDLEKKLELIEAGKIAAGGLLQTIRDENLWAVDPDRAYADFYHYTELRWGFQKREADRKIDAFNQVRELADAGVPQDALPTNPWQTRDLAVLINKTDVATAAGAWQKALTDSQDTTINPAGRLTGAFLKGYVDAALQTAGAQRRQGSSRARAGSTTTASNGKVVHVTGHTRQVSAPAAQAPTPSLNASPAPAPAPAVQAPSTNGLGIVPPAAVSAEVLFELADDVKAHRISLSNPLARTPLFEGLAELLEQVAAMVTPGIGAGAEASRLILAATDLAATLTNAK